MGVGARGGTGFHGVPFQKGGSLLFSLRACFPSAIWHSVAQVPQREPPGQAPPCSVCLDGLTDTPPSLGEGRALPSLLWLPEASGQLVGSVCAAFLNHELLLIISSHSFPSMGHLLGFCVLVCGSGFGGGVGSSVVVRKNHREPDTAGSS